MRERVHRGRAGPAPARRPQRAPGPALLLQQRLGNRVVARMMSDDDVPGQVQIPRVTAPGQIHALEKLGQNYKAMASKTNEGEPQPFAVAPKSTMDQDVIAINAYIDAVNGGGDGSGLGVTRDTTADPPRVRYTVGQRTYSTHTDSSQLYPISGTGIDNGTGPVAMATVLRRHNQLNLNRYLTLAQLAEGKANLEPPNRMKTREKDRLKQAFRDMTGIDPPGS